MRNRAKCKLCSSVIESLLENDFVSCSCGEISIGGGDKNFKCIATDWKNFLRVDDEGNEILVKVEDKLNSPLGINELFQELETIVSYYQDRIPQQVMTSFVNHYDLYSALIVIQNILRKLHLK